MGMLQSLETCLQIELHSLRCSQDAPSSQHTVTVTYLKVGSLIQPIILRSRFTPTRARAVGHDCHASGREAGAKIYSSLMMLTKAKGTGY